MDKVGLGSRYHGNDANKRDSPDVIKMWVKSEIQVLYFEVFHVIHIYPHR